MNNFIIKSFLGLFLLFISGFSVAQENKQTTWHNPANTSFKTVHNQLWSGTEINSFYDRLPANAQKNVRKEVWDLSRNAAGLKLVFNTNATEIVVRYTVTRKRYAMDHFPATGVSGVDLFAKNTNGTWAWANGTYQFKDTITYKYTNLSLDKDQYTGGREFHLYLPLYNSLKWLEIGVPEGSTFKFIPVPDEKPIVVYGTSIAQGGCASRAGMAWTNLLNRQLHTPVVNLGFSGNGRLEKELVDLLAQQEAKIFILDCLPNLLKEGEKVRTKIIEAVNTIRAKYPNTPIILADHSAYIDNRMDAVSAAQISNINKISYDTFKELKSKQVKELYYLTNKAIGLDMDDSVDGTHPTDKGMFKYAIAYKNLIDKILKKR